jgi:hypothetical protein
MPSPSRHFFFEATTRAIKYGRHLARLIAARAPAWARVIATQVALEVIEQTRWLAAEWAARCVFILFYFANVDMLTSIRAKAMVGIFFDNFFTNTGGEPAHVQGAFARIAYALGKVIVVRIAVHLLDQAVRLFFCLKHVLTPCHTAGLSEAQSGTATATHRWR